MGRTRQQWSILATRPQRTIALPLTVLSVSLVAAAQKTAPASFRVIYSFTGGKDDAYPYGGLVIDRNGNLYGTASQGEAQRSCPPANDGCGAVIKRTSAKSGWILRPLYLFHGGGWVRSRA